MLMARDLESRVKPVEVLSVQDGKNAGRSFSVCRVDGEYFGMRVRAQQGADVGGARQVRQIFDVLCLARHLFPKIDSGLLFVHFRRTFLAPPSTALRAQDMLCAFARVRACSNSVVSSPAKPFPVSAALHASLS